MAGAMAAMVLNGDRTVVSAGRCSVGGAGGVVRARGVGRVVLTG